LHRIVTQLFFLSVACPCLFANDSLPTRPAPAAVSAVSEAAPPAMEETEEEALPASPGPSLVLEAELRSVHRYLISLGCKVAPLDEIRDPEALALEKNADTAPADVDGLMPDAAQALDTFKELVNSVGGTFDLKSAYRPTAYQAHLHEVWTKWVKGLRNNRTSGCSALREEVGAEFARHKLLLRQQPVPASDHALGLAFDAAVAMPRAARLNGKRVTVDKLAALSGMTRPDSRRDPVHFKLRAPRPAAAGYAQNSSF
jgi:D-alanyl-D-alanine dipeptidase